MSGCVVCASVLKNILFFRDNNSMGGLDITTNFGIYRNKRYFNQSELIFCYSFLYFSLRLNKYFS